MSTVRQLRSHLRFRMRLYSRFMTDAGLMAVGFILIVLGGHSATDVIGWTTSALGAALFARDTHERWRRHQQTRIVENEDYADLLAHSIFPEGFALYAGRILGPAQAEIDQATLATLSVRDCRPYLSNDLVNSALDGASNPLKVKGHKYELPEILKDHQARCVNLKKPQFNDAKLGLRTDVTRLSLEEERTVTLQNTDYFSGTATNEMACEQFELAQKDHKGMPALLTAVSDMVVTGGRLVDLVDSELSNHIGVSTLVLSNDDEVILQDQGVQCVGANESAVGASGSLDAADFKHIGAAKTLQALCRYGMEREAREELGAHFPQPGIHTVLTGYARFLARGGKPEFFGISRSSTVRSAMKPGKADLTFVSGIRGIPFQATPHGLISVIDQLLGEGTARRRYSPSMIVCLRLARNLLFNADESVLARLSLSRANQSLPRL